MTRDDMVSDIGLDELLTAQILVQECTPVQIVHCQVNDSTVEGTAKLVSYSSYLW